MSKAAQAENIYAQTRHYAHLSRAAVEEASDGALSASRLEKIENGTQAARPEDVILMADIYDQPKLCNYYCTNECGIGRKYVPQVQTVHDLTQITMQLLSNLNSINRDKDRIIDITADGQITPDEQADFELFQQHLSEMSLAIETLKLWADKRQF
jgi:hypothetical protein